MLVKLGIISPIFPGENSKNTWNHHPEYMIIPKNWNYCTGKNIVFVVNRQLKINYMIDH